jgi:hypothetical protein
MKGELKGTLSYAFELSCVVEFLDNIHSFGDRYLGVRRVQKVGVTYGRDISDTLTTKREIPIKAPLL